MRKLGMAALAATMVGGLSVLCVGLATAQNTGVTCTQENGTNSAGSPDGSGHTDASNNGSSCGVGIIDNDSSSGSAVGGDTIVVTPTTLTPAP